jgi:hypothetical protein
VIVAGSAWTNQIVSLIILSASTTGFSGFFAYSPAPGAGNLTSSQAPVSGTDPYGNHYLAGVASYGAGFAAVLTAGAVLFYTGSLSGGWTQAASIAIDGFGDLALLAGTGRSTITTNNTLDDGSGNMSVAGLTVAGSSNTGSGNNGGVTSGPSGTVNAFPAAGPNHTHAEVHQHPF